MWLLQMLGSQTFENKGGLLSPKKEPHVGPQARVFLLPPSSLVQRSGGKQNLKAANSDCQPLDGTSMYGPKDSDKGFHTSGDTYGILSKPELWAPSAQTLLLSFCAGNLGISTTMQALGSKVGGKNARSFSSEPWHIHLLHTFKPHPTVLETL